MNAQRLVEKSANSTRYFAIAQRLVEKNSESVPKSYSLLRTRKTGTDCPCEEKQSVEE
ncbi:MAG: hypothetical protein V7K88_06165 [Nostoc sp.]|uniref:hypothetical protein n=1 Tax=Nostoc sp. TaxID=1180 RepID=UPI002FFA9145